MLECFFSGIRVWSSGMRAGVISQIGLGGGLLGWKDRGNYAMSVTIAGDRVDVCENMFSSTLFSVFLHLIISHNGIIFASYCKCIIANKK